MQKLATDLVADDVALNLQSIGRRPAAKSIGGEWIEPLVLKIWAEEGLMPDSVPCSTNINMTLASGWPSICVGLCEAYAYHSEDEYVVRESLPIGWRLLLQLTEKFVLKGPIAGGLVCWRNSTNKNFINWFSIRLPIWL